LHATAADPAEIIDLFPLSRRYRTAILLLTLITVFDSFDLTLVGFLGAAIAKQNHFTYGQLSAIVIAAGAGGILGALAAGELSDRFGRRSAVVLGTAICGLSSLGVLLVPNGAWRTLILLRFFVGVGIAATAAPAMTLAVEYTPRRHRFLLASLPVVGATGGALIATASIAGLIDTLGWRGLAALGFAPALLGLTLCVVAPESPPWLAARGRLEEARNAIARLLNLPVEVIPFPTASRVSAPEHVPFREVFRDRRRALLTLTLWGGILMADSGVYLWGPTMVAVALGTSAATTAKIFMAIALAGIFGKLCFAVLPRIVSRRRVNEIGCFGGAIALGAIVFFHSKEVAGLPALVVLLVLGSVFFDGVIANLAPYTVEIYPTRLAARGYGLGQAGNSAAKLLAPMALAMLTGTSGYVTNTPTAASLGSCFAFLSASILLAGLASLFFPLDPLGSHGY